MNYYEIKLRYNSDLPEDTVGDVLAGELAEIGFESFTNTTNELTGYISEKLYDREALASCIDQFPLADTTFEYEEKFIAGRDWNEEWEKNYFKPIRIGNECIIRASFHPQEEGYPYPIVIDPKMAFGTGNHETTFLMISEMLPLDLENKEVLDMGCGTAVLAILAAMKKASRITAIDIDEWAYQNALANTQLNNTGNIKVIQGGADQIPAGSLFDYIFANINRNILLADMEKYSHHMKAGSYLYLSGFYKEDIPVMEAEIRRLDLVIESMDEKNNWVVLKVGKKVD